MGQRKGFGAVCERDRTLSRGVKHGKEVDEKCDQAGAGRSQRDESAQASREKRPGHLEREKKKRKKKSATLEAPRDDVG